MMNKNFVLYSMVLLGLFIRCEEKAVTTMATEVWQVTIGENDGYGTSTFNKKSDNTIDTEGEWYFYEGDTTVQCTYQSGKASVENDSLKFEANGEAYYPGAPVGYQHSPFVLKVRGKTANGTFQGNFTIAFSTFGWPPTKSGVATATRIEGGGITP